MIFQYKKNDIKTKYILFINKFMEELSDNQYVYQKTKYPNIFKNTYWGKRVETDDVIITNRNKFVENNNIKRFAKSIPYQVEENEIFKHYQEHIFDHEEYYLTMNKHYILISSPYISNENKQDKIYDELGWIKIDKLYDSGASTYMKII